MARARQLDWQRATVSPDRISVPLDGDPDDEWLDRFQQARLDANRERSLANLPHVQIDLREGQVAASGFGEGDGDGVRRLLGAVVDAANEAGRRRAPPRRRA
jgi:hypothetical protein